MPNDTAKQLREILQNVRKRIPKEEFCGLGVIIYSNIKDLPILPLCPNQAIEKGKELVEQLALASFYSNPCHDGFHLISDKLELTHKNQYFAPQIPAQKDAFDFGLMNRGARYMSAQIGSLIPSVCCIGIFSNRDGLVVFQDGKEIL